MMAASALPLLSDVTMSVQGLTSCELYPFPVPDLYCGQPLLVAGKYEGSWPGAIDLNGNLPNGAGEGQVAGKLCCIIRVPGASLCIWCSCTSALSTILWRSSLHAALMHITA